MQCLWYFLGLIITIPRSSNSLSRSASWSLKPCNLPLVASAIDGCICNLNSVWPSRPLAAAAWAWAWAWSCWQVAYILRLVAIKNTPSTSQSYIKQKIQLITYSNLVHFNVILPNLTHWLTWKSQRSFKMGLVKKVVFLAISNYK